MGTVQNTTVGASTRVHEPSFDHIDRRCNYCCTEASPCCRNKVTRHVVGEKTESQDLRFDEIVGDQLGCVDYGVAGNIGRGP